MKIFTVHLNGELTRMFENTLEAAQRAAMPLVNQGTLTIEHQCAPATTAQWRFDSDVADWVRTQ
jgi:hypothetical protein